MEERVLDARSLQHDVTVCCRLRRSDWSNEVGQPKCVIVRLLQVQKFQGKGAMHRPMSQGSDQHGSEEIMKNERLFFTQISETTLLRNISKKNTFY